MRPPALERPWFPTRDAALERLAEFIPRAGRDYARTRNADHGPAERQNVSGLSPYVRLRLLTETEVLAAVLERHKPSAAEKFVQEVFWRTYWKGWLESHPAAWTRYCSGLAAQLRLLEDEPGRRVAYTAAVDGRTGIDAFDAWVRELAQTNYLHNHARMWFASIWIFTLGLPWELGADLFMRQLLDGDPASNTLSWRWVAGLHTRGRTYAATRDNIRRYTGDRFELTAPLARAPVALEDPLVPATPLPTLTTRPVISGPALLVIHDDDLHGDLGELPAGIAGVCAVLSTAGRSPLPVSGAVQAFAQAAARGTVSRIAGAIGARELGVLCFDQTLEPVSAAAEACGATTIVVPFAPVGPGRDLADRLSAAAAACGREYVEFGRRYDAVCWPAAKRGFFDLRTRIPGLLAELGIGPG